MLCTVIVTKLQLLILQHLIRGNKGSKNTLSEPSTLIPLSGACCAAKIHCCNFETKAIFCLSVLFLFLFLGHIWSRYQKPSCPSDSTTTLFSTPHAVNHQNRAQRFSEVRDVQLDLCHHLRTAVTSKILTCQGRKHRHCTVTVLKY